MKQLSRIAAAAALTLCSLAAQAQFLLVDNFNSPAVSQVVTDTTSGNGSVTGATLALPAGQIATDRTISANLLTGVDSAAEIRVGGVSGRLRASVDAEGTASAAVVWTMSSFALPPAGPYSILFSIIASNLGNNGAGSVPTFLDFSFNGAGANDFMKQIVLGSVLNSESFFALSNQEALFLSGGGTLTMTISSAGQAWDLSLDQFAISIPEPTSLALTGLALLGAGLAARRRKA